MAECGTATFTNPDDYRSGIGGTKVNLVLTGRGDFKARLAWLKLRHLHVLRSRESMPRITYVSLPPSRAFVSFPLGSGAAATWSGIALRPGDVVFHARGERAHVWTKGTTKWGLVSLPLGQLAAYGKALSGPELAPPAAGRVLRPSAAAVALLRRLHAKACHIAETRPETIANQGAAHALEQELVHALVDCLTAADAHGNLATKRHHASIMLRFEDVLSAQASRQLSMSELCAAVGVPERTLRACCTEFLGLSPSRYLRLRRLNMVRAALRCADPASASVAEIAQRYQFSELGRFAAAYRAIFGETPSATLRRTAIKMA
jgi:AraC-like DNA-binding protein